MSTNLARTILGPLTTTATLPATCTLPVAQCLTCGQAWRGQTCFASAEVSSTAFGVQDNTDCWPETTSFVAQPTLPLEGWGFYSPGIMCPSGMYSACSATAGGSSGWPVQFGMLTGETAVGCCPTGFTCANNYVQTCLSTASKTTFSVVNCDSGSIGATTQITLPQTLTSTVSSSLSVFLQSQYVLSAPLIQINWQASDRSSSTTTSGSSTTLTSTPTSTSTSPASQTSTTQSPQSSGTSSGLSTGAKAGLGVGVAIGALLFLALAFFIYRKRKNAYSRTGQDSPTSTQPLGHGSSQPVFEMNQGRKDLYSGHPEYELPSAQQVSELSTPMGQKPQKPPGQVHEMYA